jgi:formamidopyrimidine-DNA glycosylase
MPELPSVEMFKDYFDSTSLQQKIKKVDMRSPEILMNTDPNQLQKALEGQVFSTSRRYGKYLFCQLDNGFFLILHFGMTGYLKYFRKNGSKHIRLLITFQNGHKLALDDMRKFGKVGLTPDPDEFVREKNLGPDALAIDFNLFKKLFKGRKGTIKPLIMNQNFIAGIGNLYADEILYQSGIHPLTKADNLNQNKLKTLYGAMKKVLNVAITHRDQPSNMPSSFLLPHRYQGGECPSGEMVEILKVGGRTTYFCPDYQK